VKIIVFLLTVGLLLAGSATATTINARSSMSSFDCGGGLHTYMGTHIGMIMVLHSYDEGKTWQTRGWLNYCDFWGLLVGSSCSVQGNTSVTETLVCSTQSDQPCEKSIKASTEAGVFGSPDPEATHKNVSACYQPTGCTKPKI